MTTEHEFLTVTALAVRMGVHRNTVDRWIRKGFVSVQRRVTAATVITLIDWTLLEKKLETMTPHTRRKQGRPTKLCP